MKKYLTLLTQHLSIIVGLLVGLFALSHQELVALASLLSLNHELSKFVGRAEIDSKELRAEYEQIKDLFKNINYLQDMAKDTFYYLYINETINANAQILYQATELFPKITQDSAIHYMHFMNTSANEKLDTFTKTARAVIASLTYPGFTYTDNDQKITPHYELIAMLCTLPKHEKQLLKNWISTTIDYFTSNLSTFTKILKVAAEGADINDRIRIPKQLHNKPWRYAIAMYATITSDPSFISPGELEKIVVKHIIDTDGMLAEKIETLAHITNSWIQTNWDINSIASQFAKTRNLAIATSGTPITADTSAVILRSWVKTDQPWLSEEKLDPALRLHHFLRTILQHVNT